MSKRIFTSESVTEGHPDKICDQISDGVLDAILAKDPQARVACECATTTGLVLVMGEITTNCYVDIAGIARDTITKIGYDNAEFGFDGRSCAVLTAIDKQSEDIAMGVDASYDDANQEGAGDQGMMFGFACDETPCYMPFGYVLANELSRKLTEVRKNGTLPYLRPDGKTQVTVEYDGDKVVRLANIVVSSQHSADVSLEQIRRDIIKYVIEPVVPAKYIDDKTEIFVNPTGRFVIGGPDGDSGLTGRKIIVDTYGGYGRHGGGAFSGKDPTKVDRSACYAARYIAKNIVAAGIAKKCEVQIAYAIGVAKPLCVNINTFGTGICADDRIAAAVSEVVDLRPAAIIDYFGLRAPIYRELSAFGHFGREELGVRWEKIDIADKLLEKIK